MFSQCSDKFLYFIYNRNKTWVSYVFALISYLIFKFVVDDEWTYFVATTDKA